MGHGDQSYPMPKPGEVYRCPVCRLAVTFNPAVQKMVPVVQAKKAAV